MILNLAVFVFQIVPLLSLTASTVVALHSPTRVRGESYNGSSTVLVKWSNQEGVSYYKAALKLPTLQHSIMAHKSAFELTADNLTRIACFKTLGGRCRGKSEVSVLWGPGRIWTYGSEMSLQVGACSTNKSETCLMSSWVKFVVPLGVPDSVELLRAKAVPGLGIDVSWYPPFEPRGPITKYIMSYKTAKDEIKTKQVDGLKTYVVIRNLNPATNYTIWVTAYNARYKGLKSEEVMAMTFEDGCSPSPCAYNSTCRSLDSKLNCECVGAWKGLFCNEPRGYAVVVGKCFASASENNHRWYKYYNVSLASCKAVCDWTKDSSYKPCKSFVYALGYDGTVYSGKLRDYGLGSCYLSQDVNSTGLVPCVGDFYEVAPESHSAAKSLNHGLATLFIYLLIFIVI